MPSAMRNLSSWRSSTAPCAITSGCLPSRERSNQMTEGASVRPRLSTGIAVIGAGQAGLSAAYHLQRLGHEPVKDFVVLDANPKAGGAWQHRWPGLTLSTVNRIHDLPGLAFSDTTTGDSTRVRANVAVPDYFSTYENEFGLPVFRPVRVRSVRGQRDGFQLETDRGQIVARGIINATGTWETPHLPHYPGAERFRGRQLHTRDYVTAEEFAGQHVIVVGGGISAVQLLDEVSREIGRASCRGRGEIAGKSGAERKRREKKEGEHGT